LRVAVSAICDKNIATISYPETLGGGSRASGAIFLTPLPISILDQKQNETDRSHVPTARQIDEQGRYISER